MAKVGYARVSSQDQNLDRQLIALKEAGCEKIFAEKISGKNSDRPELKAMLEYIRENDQCYCLSLSRLSRSSRDLQNLVHEITETGCQLIFLNESIDTSTPVGKLFLTVLGAISQFERESLLDRQKTGIQAARLRQVKFGRPRKEIPENFSSVVQRWRDGKLKAVEAIRELGISKTRFYALVKE